MYPLVGDERVLRPQRLPTLPTLELGRLVVLHVRPEVGRRPAEGTLRTLVLGVRGVLGDDVPLVARVGPELLGALGALADAVVLVVHVPDVRAEHALVREPLGADVAEDEEGGVLRLRADVDELVLLEALLDHRAEVAVLAVVGVLLRVRHDRVVLELLLRLQGLAARLALEGVGRELPGLQELELALLGLEPAHPALVVDAGEKVGGEVVWFHRYSFLAKKRGRAERDPDWLSCIQINLNWLLIHGGGP